MVLAAALTLTAVVCCNDTAYAAGGGKTSEPSSRLESREGETITVDNPLILLEIVPDHCYGTLGYFVEGNEPVDITKMVSADWPLSDANNGILNVEWKQDTATWAWIAEFTSNNNFIRTVWGTEEDGSLKVSPDCIKVVSMTPGELNRDYADSAPGESVLDKAALITISTTAYATQVGAYCNNFHNYISEDYYNNLNPEFFAVSGRDALKASHDSCEKGYTISNDLSSEVSVRLYERVKRDNVLFVGDYATLNMSHDLNVYKVMRLMRIMDYEYFVSLYPFMLKSDYPDAARYQEAVSAARSAKKNFVSVDTNDKLVFNGRTMSWTDYVTADYKNAVEKVDWTEQYFYPYMGTAQEYTDKAEGTLFTYLENNPVISNKFNEYLAGLGGSRTWKQIMDYVMTKNRDMGLLANAFQSMAGCLVQNANYYYRGSVLGWNGNGSLFTYDMASLSAAFYDSIDYYQNVGITYDIKGDGTTDTVFKFMDVKICEFSEVADKKTNSFSFAQTITKGIEYYYVPNAIDLQSGLKVLELEPYAYYQYTGYAGAVAIASMLGTDVSVITPENYKIYVDVDFLTTSQFNGMTKDMVSEYDLIILGCSYEGGTEYLNASNNGKVYFKTDGDIQGNDLTAKAAGIFSEVADSGVPIIMDDKVYDGSAIAAGTQLESLVNYVKSRKNAFRTSDLQRAEEDTVNYSQYNLRNILNAIAGKIPFIQSVVLNGDSSLSVSVFSEESAAYGIEVRYDLNGNGSADFSQSASVGTTAPGTSAEGMEGYVGSVTVPPLDTALLEYSDYYTVTVSVTLNAGSELSFLYYPDGATDEAVTATVTVSNLRDTRSEIYGEGMVISDTAVLLQVIPDGGGDVMNLSEPGTVFAQKLYDVVAPFDFEVRTVEVKDLASVYNIGQYEMVIVSAPLSDSDDEYGVIEEYMNSGEDGRLKPVVFTYGSADNAEATIRGKLGLADLRSNSYHYTKAGAAWMSGSAPYAGAGAAGSTVKTSADKASVLNEGQIAVYPYNVLAYGRTIDIKEVAAGSWYLNLEDIAGDDVTVWYTLGDGDPGKNNTYTNYRGQDGANNYYLYSVGNCYYTLFGQKDNNNAAENELFVNLLVLSFIDYYDDLEEEVDSTIYNLD